MLTLKNKLDILFKNETDRTTLVDQSHGSRTNVIRRQIREICEESSALGLADLEQETLGLTQDEMNTGTPVTFDLLQVAYPISVRATCTRYGEKGSNYVFVSVKVNLVEGKSSYTIEHPICEFYVESVSLPRLYKRLERILKDVPSIVAPLLAN